MTNLGDIYNKEYRFEFTPSKNPWNGEGIPKTSSTADDTLRFTYEELYYLRNFFKEFGRDASFDDLEEFNEDMYEENRDFLADMLYLQLDRLRAKDEALDMSITFDDYEVVWPEELINDVLDDNFLDWKEIEDKMNEEELF